MTDTRNRCDFSDTEEVTHLKPQVNAYLAVAGTPGHDVCFAPCAIRVPERSACYLGRTNLYKFQYTIDHG